MYTGNMGLQSSTTCTLEQAAHNECQSALQLVMTVPKLTTFIGSIIISSPSCCTPSRSQGLCPNRMSLLSNSSSAEDAIQCRSCSNGSTIQKCCHERCSHRGLQPQPALASGCRTHLNQYSALGLMKRMLAWMAASVFVGLRTDQHGPGFAWTRANLVSAGAARGPAPAPLTVLSIH